MGRRPSSARSQPMPGAAGPAGPRSIKDAFASSMLARSLRIFPTALSPHSLASPPVLYRSLADSGATEPVGLPA